MTLEHRLLVTFDGETYREFVTLQQLTEASPTLLLQRALSVYSALYEAQAAGAKVLVQDRTSGETREVVIP